MAFTIIVENTMLPADAVRIALADPGQAHHTSMSEKWILLAVRSQ